MTLKYVIRYRWPDGKIRYRTDVSMVEDKSDAHVYSLRESRTHLNNSDDARIVWDIETTRERI